MYELKTAEARRVGELADLATQLNDLIDDLIAVDDRKDHQAECTCDNLCKASTVLMEAQAYLHHALQDAKVMAEVARLAKE